MAGCSIHRSDVNDPDLSIAGDENTDMNEAAPDNSFVETDEWSYSDVSSSVTMDICEPTLIDSIETPSSLIDNKWTPINTFQHLL